MDSRYLLLLIGGSEGIERDLNFVANGDTGVNFIDGKGMFICTFYSPYTTAEIHEKLSHRAAMMVFNITDPDSYGINLPSKYFTGIFPEIQKTLEMTQSTLEVKTKSRRRGSKKKTETKKAVEEFDNVDDILDKLSRNNYDRSCLTEKEIEILNKA